ncbi:MAG: SPFH domain-containing protein [Planctomycetota bacterium]
MQGDVINYGRATSVGVLGAVIQTLLTVGFAVYAAYSGGDHAAWTTTVYVGMGIPVWLSLVLLYDQHRRERLEAIEAERMASDPMGSAFDQAGEDLRVAARRLAGIQKYVLPIIGLSVASVLVSVGFVRFGQGSQLVDPDVYQATDLRGWAAAVGLAAGFVGFVFARFVSGMGKQRVWAALRGGASIAVGSALFGLAIAVGHLVDMAGGGDAVLRYLQLVFPAALIVLGFEIVLNFVLDIYRPRAAGEDPRPCFDSRLLGLLAAPDKIAENIGEALNYQFGIEVSQTWFYQIVQRWWPALVGLALFLIWGMTSFVVIEPHQRAVIMRFGQVVKEDVEPGLHFKWPSPIGSVYIPSGEDFAVDGFGVQTATGIRTMQLGTNPANEDARAILWTEQHATEELFNLVQPAAIRASGAADGEQVDLSLVAVEIPVQWSVDDVLKYDKFAQPGHREALLKAVGQRAAMLYLSELTIDEVLATRRTELADGLRERLSEDLSALQAGEGPGVEVHFVGAGNGHPPQDVAEPFERVVQARQNRESQVEAARQLEIQALTRAAGSVSLARQIVDDLDSLDDLRTNGARDDVLAERELAVQRLLEDAGGEAGALLINASAQRWQRHMGERAKAALYQGQLAAYEASPQLFRSSRYFEALAEAMVDSRVFLTAGDLRNELTVRMELMTRDTGVDVFDPEIGSANQQQ